MFADGVQGFGGGLAIVGERGPELVNLPGGSSVIPNNRMSDYTGRGSNGDMYYTVQVANGVTPEQMNMHVQAALQAYHPHAMKAAVQAVHDHASRMPASSR